MTRTILSPDFTDEQADAVRPTCGCCGAEMALGYDHEVDDERTDSRTLYVLRFGCYACEQAELARSGLIERTDPAFLTNCQGRRDEHYTSVVAERDDEGEFSP